MTKLKENIQHYIEKKIIPHYQTFDSAHNIDHIRTVIEESLKLAQYYEVDINMVFVIAAFHDLGLTNGRENHHIDSGKILENDVLISSEFSEEQIKIMKEAVEDHRASNKHEPRSIYGRIVAEADRIIDPNITLLRTVQYGKDNYPDLDLESQYERFCAHLKNKYSENGYLKLWIPYSSNAEKLDELRKIINNEELLRKTFEELYNTHSLSK
ncbi:HD domain-containing protein [Odoribacter sp. OttesenSCG-928-L07]|nr:HD domain-containing protein [Odoribacter sp. OttesenSCG-928-L07]MDL2241257.1 HD domain-containing protein [Bacteroidales bacterium OttesenSCG-928-K22]